MSPRNTKQAGFTLVELLIVVIILGILAAVVIPQFNSAANESKEAAIASNLATVRQAVEMYKVQHDDAFPPAATGAAFVDQLVESTDIDGDTTGSTYGPYIRNGMPNNPDNGLNTVDVTADMSAYTADDSTGWVYDTVTGEFKANSTATGPSGTAYFDL